MAHRKSRFNAMFRKNRTCVDTMHLPLGSFPARRLLHLQQQGAKYPVEHIEHQQIDHHLPFNSFKVCRFGRKRPQVVTTRRGSAQ